MKKIDRLLFVFLAICMLAGCAIGPGSQDWTYYGLPGDYSLWRNNTRDISIGVGKEKGMAEIVVNAYVSELYFNDEYITAKQVEVPESTDEKIALDAPVYYIICVGDGTVLGPLGVNAFESKCAALGITDIQWRDSKSYAKAAAASAE